MNSNIIIMIIIFHRQVATVVCVFTPTSKCCVSGCEYRDPPNLWSTQLSQEFNAHDGKQICSQSLYLRNRMFTSGHWAPIQTTSSPDIRKHVGVLTLLPLVLCAEDVAAFVAKKKKKGWLKVPYIHSTTTGLLDGCCCNGGALRCNVHNQ